ncbi:MAG TPA: hypothetical protein VK654_02230 [Nitrospirota bacterium]|nr:hypothetical protein [Nitrospirota bacterium]
MQGFVILFLSLFLFMFSAVEAEPRSDQGTATQPGAPVDSADHAPRAVALSPDGGLLIAGNSFSREQGMSLWIWKVSDAGDLVWEKRIKSQFQDEIKAVAALPDGGVLLLGQLFVYAPETGYVSWIMRLDKKGSIVFEKRMQGIGWPDVLVSAADGNFLFGGNLRRTETGDKAAYDFRVVKFSPMGDVIWERTYTRGNDQSAFAGLAADQRSFLVAGTSGKYSRFSEGAYTGWLMKIDASGAVLGEMKLPDCEAMSGGGHLAQNGSEYAVAYSTSQRPSADVVRPLTTAQARILGFNSALKTLWQVNRGGYQPSSSPLIAAVQDKNYIVAGAVQNGIRIDKLAAGGGHLIWEKQIDIEPGDHDRLTVDCLIVRNKTAYITGSIGARPKGSTGSRIFLLKVDAGVGEVLVKKIY